MYLLIDAGNSRLKWLYGRAVPGIVEAVSYKTNWQERLYRAWHLLPEPRHIALSNVNNQDIADFIQDLAQQLWHKDVTTFVPQKHNPLNITLAYQEPEKFGTDRFLALLGARDLSQQALCVIGCGTAITLDALDKHGNHLGGFILPGIRLCENALLNHTQKLVPMRWTAQILGTDTASCIGAGIHHALPAGINAIADELENKYGEYFQRFAFGGDAQILFGQQPNYQIEPDLIFRGMLAHLREETM